MPRINVRLNDVSSGFEVIPEDTYQVEILENSKLKTSSGGNPQIGWLAKILDGEFEGKRIYWETSLLDQSLWVLKSMLEVIGLEWEEDGFELEDTFGCVLFVDVTVEQWEGEDRNKVQGYHAV